ncbi:MAG: adenine deaminase C-terminal domain-containing protein [Actinomycetota bacterium]
MRLPARLRLDSVARRHVVDVAAGRVPADLVVRGGAILNVYTSRLEPGAVGIAGGRIAWVGDPEDREAQAVLDVDGAVVAPGLIEPHCHPDILYTPGAAVPAYITHGTTTVSADIAFLLLSLDDDVLVGVLEAMAGASVKFLWNLRGCLDGLLPLEAERLSTERLARLLEGVPGVVGSGELTAWPRLLAGDERIVTFTEAVIDAGLRVDGHCAGTSPRTLGALACAGISADHEAITPNEVEQRLRLGYWVMLRHSSLRLDGPELAAGLVASGLPTDRVMLTTDGPIPSDLAAGHLDAVIHSVVAAGLDPVTAVRMGSLHPAVYLGLDAHLGGIAPGRCADLVVVESVGSFTPRLVVTDGRPVISERAADGAVTWRNLEDEGLLPATLDDRTVADVCRAGPTMTLEGVITRAAASIEGPLPFDASYVALVSRRGDWITGGILRGLRLRALVSSFTGSRDILLLGHDLQAMVAAYRRVVALGGGIVTPDAELPLTVLGRLYDGPLEILAAKLTGLEATLEQSPPVPLPYLLLFLSLAVLPDIRLSPAGVVHVKTGEVLQPPVPLPTPALSMR